MILSYLGGGNLSQWNNIIKRKPSVVFKKYKISILYHIITYYITILYYCLENIKLRQNVKGSKIKYCTKKWGYSNKNNIGTITKRKMTRN